jgi:hypothetical protein
VKADIERAHSNATLLDGNTNVMLGTAVGRKATYRWEEKLAGGSRTVLSDVYLFGWGEWFIKYRFTYPESSTDAASESISEFMTSLAWN